MSFFRFATVALCTFAFSFSDAKSAERAPEEFKVLFETSKGNFTIQVTRKWAPNGADRFLELVKAGFYDECRFFRVLPGFVVQWGMNGDPRVQAKWQNNKIKDDPVAVSNQRGSITFATSGRDSRTAQVFINFADNSRLDSMGFAPFGRVIEGMKVVESFNAEHLQKPNQGRISAQGNEYLNSQFPDLDYIKSAKVVQ